MSHARARYPGTFYHIARRCHRREFRFRPDDDFNGAVTVLVQDASEATGVQVVAMCWMSDHYHAVVYDPGGRLPDWTAHVHGLIARYCNAAQRTRSHVWDAEEENDQVLGDLETVAAFTAYTIANPVKAGLVYSPAAWPGVCSTLKDVATNLGPTARRPAGFFRANGPVSELGHIAHICPPGTTPTAFRRRVATHLHAMLGRARDAVKSSARGFLGAAKILAASPFERAKSEEVPNVGSKAKKTRRFRTANHAHALALVDRQARFRADYAVARAKLVGGVPNNTFHFPAGTWQLWRFCGARREPPPVTHQAGT